MEPRHEVVRRMLTEIGMLPMVYHEPGTKAHITYPMGMAMTITCHACGRLVIRGQGRWWDGPFVAFRNEV